MNNKTIDNAPSLSPGAAAFIERMNLSHPGALKAKPRENRNPYSCPRPRPFTVEEYFEGSVIDWCFESSHLRWQLEGNLAWLCYTPRTTMDIYRALFRKVDPEEIYRSEAMDYIAEGMWDLGFRRTDLPGRLDFQAWYLPNSLG